jgi:Flp pilus assembly protein TadB
MILGLSPIIILAAALLILIGFGFSGLLVSTDQAKAKRLVVRRETVLRPHMRTQSIDIALFTRAAADETTILARATSWFGIDLERTDICPVPWWTVVAAAAIAADAALSGLSMLLGSYTWIAFPLFWMGASRAVFAYFKGKRREKLIVQFPDALMMIVRYVSACRSARRSTSSPRNSHNRRRANSSGWRISCRSANQWTRPFWQWRGIRNWPNIASLPPH